MKTKLLLPHKLKKIGWIMLLPSLLLGILTLHGEFQWELLDYSQRSHPDFMESETENFTNELAGICLLFSLFFIGFSRLKIEDEYTFKLRLDSLLWGVYAHYTLVILSFIFIYSFNFFIAIMYSVYALLVIYIVRFHYYINKNEKSN